MSFSKFESEILEISNKVDQAPVGDKESVLKTELDKLDDPRMRRIALSLISIGERVQNSDTKSRSNANRTLSFVFGFAFLLILLGISFLFPTPTEFQLLVFRIVIALVGAFFGGSISGYINVKGKLGNFAIRAGGAAAFFVVIYFLNPAGL